MVFLNNSLFHRYKEEEDEIDRCFGNGIFHNNSRNQ